MEVVTREEEGERSKWEDEMCLLVKSAAAQAETYMDATDKSPLRPDASRAALAYLMAVRGLARRRGRSDGRVRRSRSWAMARSEAFSLSVMSERMNSGA